MRHLDTLDDNWLSRTVRPVQMGFHTLGEQAAYRRAHSRRAGKKRNLSRKALAKRRKQ